MNCPNCQNPIQEGEKFCGKCGSMIISDALLWDENKKMRTKWFIYLSVILCTIINLAAVYIYFESSYVILFFLFLIIQICALLFIGISNTIMSKKNLTKLNRSNKFLFYIGILSTIAVSIFFVIVIFGFVYFIKEGEMIPRTIDAIEGDVPVIFDANFKLFEECPPSDNKYYIDGEASAKLYDFDRRKKIDRPSHYYISGAVLKGDSIINFDSIEEVLGGCGEKLSDAEIKASNYISGNLDFKNKIEKYSFGGEAADKINKFNEQRRFKYASYLYIHDPVIEYKEGDYRDHDVFLVTNFSSVDEIIGEKYGKKLSEPEAVLDEVLSALAFGRRDLARIWFAPNDKLYDFLDRSDRNGIIKFHGELRDAKLTEDNSDYQVYETQAADNQGIGRNVKFKIRKGLDGRWLIEMPS